jgi:nicotinate-nucleotide adenylyltransferase
MANVTKEKIGLFGGTFDPIHTGHLIVAEIIRDALDLKRIVFVPAKRHPFKDNKVMADETHRDKMIRGAIGNNKFMEVTDMELRSNQVTYTVDTVRKIQADSACRTWDIYFLMGMDNLNQLHLWKNPDILVEICQVVVFSRPGFEPAEEAREYLPRIRIVQTPLLEISSTQIRHRVKSGQTIRYLVPAEVESYIIKNNLYTT